MEELPLPIRCRYRGPVRERGVVKPSTIKRWSDVWRRQNGSPAKTEPIEWVSRRSPSRRRMMLRFGRWRRAGFGPRFCGRGPRRRFGPRLCRRLYGEQQVRLVRVPSVANAEIDGAALPKEDRIFRLIPAGEDPDRAEIVAERLQVPFFGVVVGERDAGIVLDHDGAVGEQEIAHR